MMSFRSSSLRSLGELRERASAQLKQYSPYGHAVSWLGPSEKASSEANPAKDPREASDNTRNESENSEILEPKSAPESLFQLFHLELMAQLSTRVLERLGGQVGSKLVVRNRHWPLILDYEGLAVFVQETLWQALFGRKAGKLKRAAMSKGFAGYLIETKLFPWMRGGQFEKSTAFMKGLLAGVIRELTNVPDTEPIVHVEHQHPKLFRFFFGVPLIPEVDDHPMFAEHFRLYRYELEPSQDSSDAAGSSSTTLSSSSDTRSSRSLRRSNQTNQGCQEGSSGISEDYSCEINLKAESSSVGCSVNIGTHDSFENDWANANFLCTGTATEEQSRL